MKIEYKTIDNDIEVEKLLNDGWEIVSQMWSGQCDCLITSMIFKHTDNSNYAKCSKEVLDYINYSSESKAGIDIINIIKKHFA